jgi:hypothetical protein
MLKFTKKKTDINGEETGDFYGFDPSILYYLLKPLNARCDTAEVEITVYPIDDKTLLDEKAIRDIVILHGSKEQVEIRRKEKELSEVNAPILIKLQEIDMKSIRSIREYISSKQDAFSYIKECELDAVIERDKLEK